MRTGRIARPGQTGSFRRCRFYWVKIGEQGLAAGLPRHSHKRDKIVGRCARDAARGYATVAVSVESAAMVVHGDFVKIEQIAVIVAAALLPDPSLALNGI